MNLPEAPILDAREQSLTVHLAGDYQRFKTPGRFDMIVRQAQKFVPGAVHDALDWAKDKEHVKKVLQAFDTWIARRASDGVAGKLSLDKNRVLSQYDLRGMNVNSFDGIPTLRSYDIEQIVRESHGAYKRTAFAQGFATGMPGLVGLPFNIVFSLILYYRAVQATAMHYGYDVSQKEELAFASLVLVDSFTRTSSDKTSLDDKPTLDPAAEFDPESLITVLMLGASADNIIKTLLERMPATPAAYLSLHAALRHHLERLLTSIGARQAVDSLENALIRRVLVIFGRRIGPLLAKSAPVLGGLLGGAFDTNLMQRALEGANLVYHRRFLLEKPERVRQHFRSTS